jgi:hypothetical protein
VDYGVSVAEAVFTWLTLLFVLASLLIQVRTVLLTLPSRWRRAVLVFLSLLGLATLAVQMQETVLNIELILAFSALAENDPVLLRAMAMSMVSLNVFMLIFTAKLGVAMVRRRRVGVKRFGAIEVLIIMGCQTLVVPSKSLFFLHALFTRRSSYTGGDCRSAKERSNANERRFSGHRPHALPRRGPRNDELVPHTDSLVPAAVLALGVYCRRWDLRDAVIRD